MKIVFIIIKELLIDEVAELHIHSSHTEKIKTNTDLKDIFLIQPYLEVFIRMLIK